ncbi:uncharacterized protein C1orf131 homolog [Culicoides brevitarsis]|uniref:uncharacterized protein C1orf131 homolog n=1 Tax=Culicoides brevitarsis TaxID=469753 RepID=UPI00307CA5EB
MSRIITKAALLAMQRGDDDFKSVVHEKKQKKTSSKPVEKSGNKFPDKPPTLLDLQRARKEVINLGISGFSDKMAKEEAEIQLAIKLGAKPPKKPYKNYKEILEEKRKVKKVQETTSERVAKKHQFGSGTSYIKYLTGNRHKTKKNPKNVLNSYGKVKAKDVANQKNKRR